jgi:hypothetical protein
MTTTRPVIFIMTMSLAWALAVVPISLVDIGKLDAFSKSLAME